MMPSQQLFSRPALLASFKTVGPLIHHALSRRAILLRGVCLTALALVGADVAQAQEGPFIYVPNLNGNDVTIIDTPTNTVLPTTIPVGSVALAAGVSGDQSRVYVSNGGDNTVSVIDSLTNTVIATIPVGFCPHSSLSLLTAHGPT
jgi:YVTN family beta-propeller protein